MNEVLRISEAARKYRVTRQAIHLAIRLKKMKADLIDGKWYVTDNYVTEYFKNRYDRSKSRHNGKLIFSKDRLSTKTISNMLNLSMQRVYYLVRSNKLKSKKCGGHIVVDRKNLEKYVSRLNKIKLQKSLLAKK